VEAQSFKFSCKKGVSVVCVYEISRVIVRSVSLGCVRVKWLLANMEALLLVEGSKEFLKASRVGSKVYIAALLEFSRKIFSCRIIWQWWPEGLHGHSGRHRW
jgi:hypothetical protein